MEGFLNPLDLSHVQEEHIKNIWRERPLQKNWKCCIEADQLDILAR